MTGQIGTPVQRDKMKIFLHFWIDFNLSAGRCPLALEVRREESHKQQPRRTDGGAIDYSASLSSSSFSSMRSRRRLSRQRSYSACAVARVHTLGLIFIAIIVEGERS